MMRRWQQWILVGVLATSACPGTARANEVDVLLNKLVEKGILTASEAQEVRNEMGPELVKSDKALDQKIEDGAKKGLPDSVKTWKWKGDLRLRNEYRSQSAGVGTDRNRQRIRFRYGFEAIANDHMTVGARLATGSTTDPISTNQNFNTSFNHMALVLDQAYVNYMPEIFGISAVKLSGGQIGNPYWHREQLVWDDDLNFQGANLHLEETLGPVNMFANGGVFSLNTDIIRSSALWTLQGGSSIQPFKGRGMEEVFEKLKLTGAIAYDDYMNVTSKAGDTTALTTAGGLKGASAALKDWNLINPNVAIDSELAGMPVGFYGDWVHNTAAFDDGNGYLLGVKVGNAKKPFDLKEGWEAGYDFEHLEDNATFGALTNSDFGNGGTNHRGSAYWLKLAVLKNSSVGLTVLNTRELGGSKNRVDTYQMDWITSF